MTVEILHGDCREVLFNIEAATVQSCVTSPPYYWQRDYGVECQIGLEPTPEEYVEQIVEVARGVHHALRDDGTFWLNIGDSYYSGNGQPKGSDPRSPSRNFMRERVRPLDVAGLGYPKKSLLGIPWRVALALQKHGWTLRSDVVWCRASAFPEPSVKDRPHRQHEMIFLFSKSRWYTFNRDQLEEESVWHIAHERAVKGHNAAFPVNLASRCIRASTNEGDIVLDPFGGSGSTGVAATKLGRKAVLIDANGEYLETARKRIGETQPELLAV